MQPSKEKLNNISDSLGRAKLRELENEGKWVFHGSRSKIEEFEPRQAYNYPANSHEERIPDGKPAVFASPSADIAIFMSIINELNIPGKFYCVFGLNSNGEITFKATKETIEQLHNATGYVYVFDKNKFIPRSPTESLSYKSVIPDDVVMVTEKDLPKNIEIKDF